MVNNIKSIIFLSCLFVIFCCCNNSNNSDKLKDSGFHNECKEDSLKSNSLRKLPLERKNKEYLNKLTHSELSKVWIEDSLGCKHHRNLRLAKKLIIENNLIGISPEKFMEIFGKPNEQFISSLDTYLVYYTETICDEDRLIEKSDKCWIKFDFIENKLKEFPEFFACE